MANKFCNLLSNQFFFHYDKIKPCCVFGQDFPINQNSFDLFKNLAEKNTWSDLCNYCKELEDKSQLSPRQVSLIDRKNIFNEDDILGVPKIIEVQIDRDCNAACIICNSSYSTTWEQYALKHLGEKYNKQEILINDRLSNIKKNIDFSHLKHIRILGGEPFKNNFHLDIINNVTNLENLIVTYTTNGSFIPNKETLDTWRKLKMVDVNISIDGIEEHFEYIRWPLKWNTLIKTLTFFKNCELDNIYIGTSYTVNPFNIFYTDRYKSWIEDFFRNSKIWYSNTFFEDGFPSFGVINLNCIPPTLKEAVGRKYGYDHRLYNLIGDFDPDSFDQFINYVNKHDTIRKLNWKKTFPEIYNLLS